MFENASAVCLRGSIRDAVPAPYARTRAAGHPATLTRAEHIQWDGTQLRQALNRQIVDLAGRGVPIKTMARTTGASCQTFRKILSGQRHDTFRQRQSALDAWSLTLEAEWNAGCKVCSELWRRLKASGFTGSLRMVSEWTTRRRCLVAMVQRSGRRQNYTPQIHKVPDVRPRQDRFAQGTVHGARMTTSAGNLSQTLPSMPTTFTSTDSGSEFCASWNRPSIQSGRKTPEDKSP